MGEIDYYRKELKRIAWRIQYRAKRDRNREISIDNVHFTSEPTFSEHSVNRILVEQYIWALTSEVGKKVIYEIYIKDKQEAQVAREMKISQQAVNKWRKKMILQLSQMKNF